MDDRQEIASAHDRHALIQKMFLIFAWRDSNRLLPEQPAGFHLAFGE
jgi:hypothetical protein